MFARWSGLAVVEQDLCCTQTRTKTSTVSWAAVRSLCCLMLTSQPWLGQSTLPRATTTSTWTESTWLPIRAWQTCPGTLLLSRLGTVSMFLSSGFITYVIWICTYGWTFTAWLYPCQLLIITGEMHIFGGEPNEWKGTIIISNGLRMGMYVHSWHYKSPYPFRLVPVPWYCAVTVFLVSHNMYDVDALPAPSAHTTNSVGRRSTALARSQPGKQTR